MTDRIIIRSVAAQEGRECAELTDQMIQRARVGAQTVFYFNVVQHLWQRWLLEDRQTRPVRALSSLHFRAKRSKRSASNPQSSNLHKFLVSEREKNINWCKSRGVPWKGSSSPELDVPSWAQACLKEGNSRGRNPPPAFRRALSPQIWTCIGAGVSMDPPPQCPQSLQGWNEINLHFSITQLHTSNSPDLSTWWPLSVCHDTERPERLYS